MWRCFYIYPRAISWFVLISYHGRFLVGIFEHAECGRRFVALVCPQCKTIGHWSEGPFKVASRICDILLALNATGPCVQLRVLFLRVQLLLWAVLQLAESLLTWPNHAPLLWGLSLVLCMVKKYLCLYMPG